MSQYQEYNVYSKMEPPPTNMVAKWDYGVNHMHEYCINTSLQITYSHISTGRVVTPCSALSQASCRSPDIGRKGQVCFQRRWVSILVKTMCEKFPPETAVAIAAIKHQQVLAPCHLVNPLPIFAGLLGWKWESCFFCKQLAQSYERL
jgi:hypothetical protein